MTGGGLTFSLNIPLGDKRMSTRFDVADALEYAARQLRNSPSFGDKCADGFTTQNIVVTRNLTEQRIVGTYAVKGRPEEETVSDEQYPDPGFEDPDIYSDHVLCILCLECMTCNLRPCSSVSGHVARSPRPTPAMEAAATDAAMIAVPEVTPVSEDEEVV